VFLFYFSVGMEDVDRCEEELIEYAIRESIRDVPIDRYSENGEDLHECIIRTSRKKFVTSP
jgi:hypothetical protein